MSDAIPIRQQDQISRLSAADIAVLGRYLFRARWQTALSLRLGVSRQIVVAWAGSKRPVSAKYTARIAQIVGEVHRVRRSWERGTYLAMIQSIESETARAIMLGMLAEEIRHLSEEIQLRVDAVAILARNGTSKGEDAR